jgi:hypothetical protein
MEAMQYKCRGCGRIFNSLKALKIHKTKKHAAADNEELRRLAYRLNLWIDLMDEAAESKRSLAEVIQDQIWVDIAAYARKHNYDLEIFMKDMEERGVLKHPPPIMLPYLI